MLDWPRAANLTFAEPGYLALLALPAALLAAWLWRLARHRVEVRRFATQRVLPARESFGPAGELSFWFCVLLACSVAILALARPQARADAAAPSARSFEPCAADRIRSALALIGARPLKPIRDGLTPSEPWAHSHLVPALWNEGQTHRRARTTGLLRLRIVRHEGGILRQLERFVSFRE